VHWVGYYTYWNLVYMGATVHAYTRQSSWNPNSNTLELDWWQQDCLTTCHHPALPLISLCSHSHQDNFSTCSRHVIWFCLLFFNCLCTKLCNLKLLEGVPFLTYLPFNVHSTYGQKVKVLWFGDGLWTNHPFCRKKCYVINCFRRLRDPLTKLNQWRC
jgi:hypothetical protein